MFRFILALAAAGALHAADAPRRAPGFALPDSKMQVHDLYDFRGKPLLLEFMNTGCPHCGAFAGVLQKVKQKYGARLNIVAVANPPDNMTTVAQYIAKQKVAYPILFDMGQAAYSYLLTTTFDLPQVFLIDAQGMIFRHFSYGPTTQSIFEGDGLMAELDRLLGAGGAAPKTAAPRKK